MVRAVVLMFVLLSVSDASKRLHEESDSGSSSIEDDINRNPVPKIGHCTNATTYNRKVTFVLYNRKYPDGIKVAPDFSDEELRSYFIEDIDVKFITHGWLESAKKCSVASIIKAYQKSSDYNLVSVDWSPISMSPNYVETMDRLKDAGVAIAIFVIRLTQVKVIPVARVHLIGHSLGAHVVGVAGFHIWYCGFGKVGRATGLDQAGPLYSGKPNEMRLDKSDAEFVDNIHTNPGVLGEKYPLGHADFYCNGGPIQPGCLVNPLCSHKRSVDLYAESIYNNSAFPAVQCDSNENFENNKCKNGRIEFMGEPTNTSARGIFSLVTYFIGECSKPPLAIN